MQRSFSHGSRSILCSSDGTSILSSLQPRPPFSPGQLWHQLRQPRHRYLLPTSPCGWTASRKRVLRLRCSWPMRDVHIKSGVQSLSSTRRPLLRVKVHLERRRLVSSLVIRSHLLWLIHPGIRHDHLAAPLHLEPFRQYPATSEMAEVVICSRVIG